MLCALMPGCPVPYAPLQMPCTLIIIIIKRHSGINPIPPMVKDWDYKKKQKQRKKLIY